MAQVIVRNLEDQVVAALKHKAQLHGRSLEKELRVILSDAARMTGEERVALVRSVRAMGAGDAEQPDSAALIREDRDSR